MTSVVFNARVIASHAELQSHNTNRIGGLHVCIGARDDAPQHYRVGFIVHSMLVCQRYPKNYAPCRVTRGETAPCYDVKRGNATFCVILIERSCTYEYTDPEELHWLNAKRGLQSSWQKLSVCWSEVVARLLVFISFQQFR